MDDFFARNRLSAYLDGELTESEMAEVARALEEQPALRAEYEALEEAAGFLRTHGPVRAPPQLHARIMARLDAEAGAAGWWSRLAIGLRRLPLQGVAVVAAAAAVVVLVWRDAPLPAGPDPRQDGAAEVEREAAVPQAPEEFLPLETAPAAGEAVGTAGDAAAASGAPRKLESGSAGRSAAPVPVAKEAPQHKAEVKGDLPEGSYIPEWDRARPGEKVGQGPDVAAAAGLAAAPFSYRLYPHHPDVLRQLVALAEGWGGQALDANGEPLQADILTVERNHARILLRIPASRLESLEPHLKRMGGLMPEQAATDQLFASDAVQVSIDVLYQP